MIDSVIEDELNSLQGDPLMVTIAMALGAAVASREMGMEYGDDIPEPLAKYIKRAVEVSDYYIDHHV